MAGRRFSNRVVVVTGAASGIGLAVARRFARAGATCALLDMDAARLNADANRSSAMPATGPWGCGAT
jgi:NAD(P)-dependent dehydrogenase (short-subunit alcohol dehydrogenase family)